MAEDGIPLCREGRLAAFQDGNAGLWCDKFARGWEDLSDPRRIRFLSGAWIGEAERLAGEQSRQEGFREELRERIERRERMVEALGGQALLARCAAPLAIGLDREHPSGRGFQWHPLYGIPWLPGSSVKGLVRRWSRLRRQGPAKGRDPSERILGRPRRAGSVIFLDALPARPVRLRREARTPHYPDYHRKGLPPGDWMEPEPLPFLAVERGALFHFSLLPAPDDPDAPRLCRTALGWLAEALDWVGIGALASLGYGRMSKERILAFRKDAPQVKPPPPEAAWLEERWRQEPWSSHRFTEEAHAFLERFPGAGPEAIGMLLGRMDALWPGIREDPEGRRGRKGDKHRFKPRQRKLAALLLARLEPPPGEPAAEEGADPGSEA